jgi:hypothetical protein
MVIPKGDVEILFKLIYPVGKCRIYLNKLMVLQWWSFFLREYEFYAILEAMPIYHPQCLK